MATAKKIAKEAAGFLPGVGTAMDFASAGQAFASGNLPLAALETASAAVGLVPGVGRVIGKALKFGAKKTGLVKLTKEDILTKDNANYKAIRGNVDETLDKKTAEELFEADEDYVKGIQKAQSNARKMDDPGKRPFQKEALELQEGKITPKEYRKTAFADVEKFDEIEELPTFTESMFALDKNKRAKGMIGLDKTIPKGKPKIEAGDKVMARLDIPAYNRFDVYVPQITYKKPDGKGAESIFSRTMVIKDVTFPTPTKPSFDIARGVQDKFPHATINGTVAKNPLTKKMFKDEEAHSIAKAVIDDDDFMHLGYNPDRGGFFYDRGTKMPVFNSPFVVQIGKQIFAKKSVETGAERIARMRKMDLRGIKDPKTKEPLIKGRPVLFNKGGATMEDQMNFAFMNEGGVLADDGVERDPVSGNEVPSGSMAEEVRDDIPAMLSEGEYVVPADVVRYHGIQTFEDLRNEAKVGLQRMEADGRIGGQPVEEQDELPFSIEELEVTEAYRGGIIGFQEGGDTGSYETAFGQPYTPGQRYGTMGTAQLGFQLRNFTNPKTGRTVTIPFFNGKPMQYIPPDFTASDVAGSGGGTFDPAADERSRQEDEAERARGTDRGMSDRAYEAARRAMSDVETQPTSFADFTAEDWQRYNSQQRGILTSVTRKIPILGYFQGLNEKAARDFAVEATTTGKNPETGEPLTKEEMDVLNKVATTPLNKSLLESLQDVIDQQKPDFLELEQDRTISADSNVPVSVTTDTDYSLPPPELSAFEGAAQQAVTDAIQFTPIDVTDDNIGDTQTVSQQAKSIIASSVNASDREVNDFGAAYANSPELWQKVSQTAFNASKLEFLMSEVGMTDAQGNSLGNTYGEIINNLEKSYNINYDESKGLFMPYRVQTQQAGAEPFLTVGVGHKLPADADPNKGYTKNEVLNFLNEDLNLARKNAERVVQEYGGNLNLLDVGPQVILTNIAAQTGGGKYSNIKDVLAGRMDKSELGGLAGFKNAVEAAIAGDWARFKTEVMNSKLGREQATDRYTQLTNDYLDINSDKNILQKEVMNDPNSVKRAGIARPTFERPQTLGVTRDQISGVASTEVLPETRNQIATRADINNIVEQNLDAAENMDDSEFRNSLRNIDLENMTTKEKFTPTFSAMDLPAQPDFQPKFVMDYGFGTLGSPDVTPAVPQKEFKLFDMSRFTTSVDRALEAIGFKDRVSRPLDSSVTQLPVNLPSGFDFNRTQLTQVPKDAGKSLAEQTREALIRTAPDQIAFEDRPYNPVVTETRGQPGAYYGVEVDRSPTSITAGGAKGTLPQVDTTTPFQDVAPLGERKVTDAKQFLKTKSAAEQAVEDALSFTPKVTPKKKQDKPAEEKISQKEYEKRVKDATNKTYDKARKDADEARDDVLKQGGSVQEAFDAAQTAFTGFTPSGEFVGPTDPGTAAMDRFSTSQGLGFKEGGLASKSKKTKPKKRNVKKGLGGKMAT